VWPTSASSPLQIESFVKDLKLSTSSMKWRNCRHWINVYERLHERLDGRKVLFLQFHTLPPKQSFNVIVHVPNQHETKVNFTKDLLTNKKGLEQKHKSIIVVPMELSIWTFKIGGSDIATIGTSYSGQSNDLHMSTLCKILKNRRVHPHPTNNFQEEYF